MAALPTLIFDFDSTLVRVETLESLADLALAGRADADAIRAEVAELTDKAMAGEIDFGQALRRRLALLPLRRDHVLALADRILDEGTPSVRRNLRFFNENADRIFILSGGFREIIAPIATRLGVAPDRVLCNDLMYDAEGRVTGVDAANPLSRENGKPEVIRDLGLSGPVVMVGDGWNDAEVKLKGAADRFYAFTEVVRRGPVVEVADAEARSIDELLHAEGLALSAQPDPHAAAGEHPSGGGRAAGGGGVFRRDDEGGPGRGRSDRPHQGCPRPGHPVQDQCHRARAGGGGSADGRGGLLHRHQPDRSRSGGRPGRGGFQRPIRTREASSNWPSV
jgi:HAD superfamily phosphoserine phosphatase-like hydrolase